MEKLVYFIGGIIVGGICTLAALGFDEEELDSIGGAFPETGDMEDKRPHHPRQSSTEEQES